MNQPEQPRPAEHRPTGNDAALASTETTNHPIEAGETAPTLAPRIWVTSELDAAHGITHGRWIDAAQPVEHLHHDIDELLATSPHQRASGELAATWAISDSRDFGGCPIGQREDLQWISLLAQGIVEYGLAFAAWANVVEAPERLTGFDSTYLGHYDNLHAYIEQLINDLGYDKLLDEAVPASIRPYVKIDITSTANDLLLGGDLHALPAPDGGVWIFRG